MKLTYAPMIASMMATLLLYSTAGAETFYVSPDGENIYHTGLTEDSPWLPQKGVDTAVGGDSVIFLDGLYELSGSLRLKNKGEAGKPITLKAKNPRAAKLHMPTQGVNDATIAIGVYDGSQGGWQEHQAMYIVIDGLDVSGGRMHAIQSAGGGQLTIRNCELHHSGMDAVKINSGADYTLIEDNLIHDTGLEDVPQCLDSSNVENCNAEGVDITSSQYVTVRRNHIHTVNGWGTYTKKGSEFTVIEHNLIHDVKEGGIGLGESTVTYNSVARNNLIYNTGLSCLQFAGGKESQIYNNTCYNVSQINGSNWAGMRAAPAGQLDGAKPGDDKYARNVSFRNNLIVLNNEFGVCFKASDPSFGPGTTSKQVHIQQLEMDNNLCINLQDTPLVFVFEGKSVTGVDTWRVYTEGLGRPLDVHSLYSDPLFISTDPAHLAFLKLMADSPAINAGVDLPDSVAVDYDGTSRPLYGGTDIGAFEYRMSVPEIIDLSVE